MGSARAACLGWCRVCALRVMHGGSLSGCRVPAGKAALPWEKRALKELLSEKTNFASDGIPCLFYFSSGNAFLRGETEVPTL